MSANNKAKKNVTKGLTRLENGMYYAIKDAVNKMDLSKRIKVAWRIIRGRW